ncbi:transglycosylase domain-containing protein [Lichenifustis flavocetrariae]|uniref:PBP1A family penicillin-binding protein n=1 Tax=Lichenifustis flavocetrariae TaxID=2949735 RepID=A0AA41YZ30_9HYPH|nr:PBP1A family penicillin-binding protein [Lichenifustis flavocetrariae]MCW6507508.1 PBP1A family penicillin-binding protein [Lichenifustis flavocetrariae]
MSQSVWLRNFGKRVSRTLLAADAWIDSSIYDIGRRSADFYARSQAWSDHVTVRGWRWFAVDIACEGLNVGLVGAVVLLALAFPVYQNMSDDWLKKSDLAVTFLDHTGKEIGRRGILHDDSVSLDQMPSYLPEAVLATEDRRFYSHFGIDVIGTMRALTVNARASGVRQGGSSITQQLAKNLFLSNERTVERKVNEAFLALWLETHLTKREILQLYLDRVYMGGGTFGIQAASQFYFGKSARDVSLAEAAMLAGLFKAPTKYAPHVNLPAARARANDVLSNLVDAGYLSEAQVYGARLNPASPVDRSRDVSPDWYLDYAYDEVRKLVQIGKLGDNRVLIVQTALDTELQKKAESTIEDQLRQNGPAYHAKQSAAVIMQPDGAVRAIVGGRDYGSSQFNRATDAQRQPGSSFKPFVYLTAIMSGKFKPSTTVVDGPVCIGNWCVHNYGGNYRGALPLQTALAHSLNTIAVKLSIAIGNGNPRLGRARIIETAHAMGLTTPLPDTVSLPVGADEVTVIDMATAYSAFANGGKRVSPFAAVDIRNGKGQVIYRHDLDGPQPVQVVPAADVATMNNMLTHVINEGTGTHARLDNVQVAGKTGTTNNYKDAWFCGFTGNYVGAVWFGNDDDSSMNEMTGGTLPARTWHDIMAFAHQGIDARPGYGIETGASADKVAAVTTSNGIVQVLSPARPAVLSLRSFAVIDSIGQLAGQRGKSQARLGAPDRVADEAPVPSVRSVGGRFSVQ